MLNFYQVLLQDLDKGNGDNRVQICHAYVTLNRSVNGNVLH